MDDFLTVFVPLFVAVSPLTVLPLFLGIADGLDEPAARRLGRAGVLTGFIVAVTVILVGGGLFSFLGIRVDDLRVAGGIILFLISIHDLIHSTEERRHASVGDDYGVVPLGVPLIVGPATLTACLVLADVHGRPVVLLALSANLLIVLALVMYAKRLARHLRPAVTRAFGKVMSLFLAAIAVAMVRTGLQNFGL
ncbi:MAG: MarC family protein [Myxococcales bacterium]|nr:MarC family protein [Myxococcales bacterium]MCB9733334.1 MarC family protein [Deltaproteobacteria bacterium]